MAWRLSDEPRGAEIFLVCLVASLVAGGYLLWLMRDPTQPDRQAAADDVVAMAWEGLFPAERDHWCYWWNHDRGHLRVTFAEQPYSWNSWQELLEDACPLPLN